MRLAGVESLRLPAVMQANFFFLFLNPNNRWLVKYSLL